MDAAGDTEQSAEAAFRLTRSGRLIRDLADDLEERGLPGTVDADEADRAPGFDLEADVSEHPAIVLRVPLVIDRRIRTNWS